MVQPHWPSENELNEIRKRVAEMSGKEKSAVRIVISPYRICPLGAHIDHQGGIVTAMTINRGILFGFVPSGDSRVLIRSGQFKGEAKFRVDEVEHPTHQTISDDDDKATSEEQECVWGNYARGALYALQRSGKRLDEGITGFISGSEGFDSAGLSSSAAVGIAYVLALENVNCIEASMEENIEYDRVIENEYLGLRNGIMDQSAILLSTRGCLTYMDCKTGDHGIIRHRPGSSPDPYVIFLAFSGLKHSLTHRPDYNNRVNECRSAASALLRHTTSSADPHHLFKCSEEEQHLEPILSNVSHQVYRANRERLRGNEARRAEHYFSEVGRVVRGMEAWASGNMKEFGDLVSASGLSSIANYECGSEPLVQLYELLVRTPGVYGARFSGAGFRGCCIAFVRPQLAAQAAASVRTEYLSLQPRLASTMHPDTSVIVCESDHSARILL